MTESKASLKCDICNEEFKSTLDVAIHNFNKHNNTNTQAKEESLTQEAERIINGERRTSYGDAVKSFDKIAQAWSPIVGVTLTAKQVAEMMIVFKVLRESNSHKRDNLVDIIGYTLLLEKICNQTQTQP